ncbi:MAG: methyltransferase domain-containing protein [Methanosarcinales archaeon]|nr:methyltransferase domain-containing protein [Methanosarcinales archaeon]
MPRYAIELSGEHETLPRAEALALLDLYATSFREIQSLDQCLVVEAEDLDADSMGRRLAMSHRIVEVLAVCRADLQDLRDALEEVPLPQLRYRVRARRVKDAPLACCDVERAAGSVLFRRGYRADLSRPEMELRGLVTGESIVFGRELARADRSGFEHRRPHLKPFFYPGVLMPRMARALVNLSQVRTGEVLLDPFSGTGGILVEACLAGAKGLGVDVQKKLVRGAGCNLEGLDCSLLAGDAKRLPLKDQSVDGVVTDPPYGRSAAIRASSRDDLLAQSLKEIHRVLKPGKRMVILADNDIGGQIIESGYEVINMFKDRVHRSLTRHIFLCSRHRNPR